MGIFARSAVEARSRLTTFNPRNPSYWVSRMFGGRDTAAGVVVDEEAALTVGGLQAGVKIIAEDLASLPLPIYEMRGKSRERADTHPLHRTLNVAFNPEMSAMSGREAVAGRALMVGNGFAEIERTAGRVHLWPLPGHMRIERNGRNGVTIAGAPDGQLAYFYTLPDGKLKIFAPDLIFNLRGFSRDGIRGHSLLRMAAEEIGLDVAMQQFGGAYFGNGAQPSGALSVQGELNEEGYQNISASWAEAHEGLDRSHRIAILEQGAKFEKIGVPPNEAQFLESRVFSVRAFARRLRLPPHMLADLADATFSNVEHLSQEYVQFTLRPWLVRWEQQANLDLIGTTQGFFAEHVVEGFLRGDSDARSKFYHQMQFDGNMTRADVARRENLPMPTDALADTAMVQVAMIPVTAFDANGMTLKDRAEIAERFVRVGFEPDATLTAFNLPPVAHTGLVPVTVQIDPDKLAASSK